MNTPMEKVIKTADIESGQMKTVSVNGAPVALANIDDTFFAVEDMCSHSQCSLGTEGYLMGNTLMCGCHGATFDMTNGKVLTLPATDGLEVYMVEVKDGWVYIGKKEI